MVGMIEAGYLAGFDWQGCAAHLDAVDPNVASEVERFLALRSRAENGPPENASESSVTVVGSDRGWLVRTSSWQAWAGGRDQLVYLLLEAFGQVFVEGYAGAVFHAGAIDLGQGALVLQGSAQAGKSLLAYAAWRAGHTVLGDDRVTLAPSLDRIGAFPRCLKLRCLSDSEITVLCEGVPRDSVVTARVGSERRVIFGRNLPGFLDYETTRPIRALIQLERSESGVSLEAIEPSEALGVALRNVVSSDFHPTAAVRLIKNQADQKRLFRLTIGEHQTEAALARLRAL
ncbi:MAG: hypothetical protein FJX66_04670 [Alphaproteobacteria bacterium]|nr:hypothetical protein [Alphaproteobacteria bacterium]